MDEDRTLEGILESPKELRGCFPMIEQSPQFALWFDGNSFSHERCGDRVNWPIIYFEYAPSSCLIHHKEEEPARQCQKHRLRVWSSRTKVGALDCAAVHDSRAFPRSCLERIDFEIP